MSERLATTRVTTDLVYHPGKLLGEEIEARGMSQRALAQAMARPYQTINAIIRGKKSITVDTALQLERVLGTDARTWLNLQTTYNLAIARREAA